jgi:hypothetical protein
MSGSTIIAAGGNTTITVNQGGKRSMCCDKDARCCDTDCCGMSTPACSCEPPKTEVNVQVNATSNSLCNGNATSDSDGTTTSDLEGHLCAGADSGSISDADAD